MRFKDQFMARALAGVLFVTILVPGMAFGQAAAAAVYSAPKEAIEKIKDEGMNRSQVMSTLSYLSDVIGPRLTNSPNMKRANEWTRDKMKEWGMQNAAVEPFGQFGRGWSVRKYSAAVVDPQFISIIGYPNAWSPSTKGIVTSEVVAVEIKSPEDFNKYKGQLRGKIVLVSPERALKPVDKAYLQRLSEEDLTKLANAPAPKGGESDHEPPPEAFKNITEYFNQKARLIKFLMAEGAAVMIQNSNQGSGGTVFVDGAAVGVEIPELKTIQDLIESAAFQPQSKKYEGSMLPQMTIATEHYNRIIRMAKLGAKPKMSVEIDSQYHDEDVNGYNTIAEIPGTDLKDEIVMLGAHLDSWHSAGGATDNGAGSAAVMEAARIIAASGLKPRRTIRVALWSGEEQGLHGSTNYVRNHFGEKKGGSLTKGKDYERLSAYYNLDNGTGKIRGVYMQGNEAVRPYFASWLVPFVETGARTLTLSNTGGTDHLPFDAIGLPGFQFIQDPVEYESRTHHSNQDTFDRIQADDMKQAATVLAAFAYQTAMMDEKLPRKSAGVKP
jgi:carboxypeptidase Q